MVNSTMMVDTKANMMETKSSPASGAEKENWLFECKACLASFKREKYLREHKRNCQPNIVKKTLQVTYDLSLKLFLLNSSYKIVAILAEESGKVFKGKCQNILGYLFQLIISFS